MRLIGLAVVLALSLLLAPLVAEAQQGTKVPRVGVLSERSPTDLFVTAFRQGLRALGYTEGQNIIVEYRYAHGIADRFPDLVGELIRLKLDVLVVGGTVAARSAKAQTTTVPIVFTLAGDPVGSGLVASLACTQVFIEGEWLCARCLEALGDLREPAAAGVSPQGH